MGSAVALAAASTIATESVKQEVELHQAKQYVADFFRQRIPQQNHIIRLNNDTSRRILYGLLQIDFHGNRVATRQLSHQNDLRRRYVPATTDTTATTATSAATLTSARASNRPDAGTGTAQLATGQGNCPDDVKVFISRQQVLAPAQQTAGEVGFFVPAADYHDVTILQDDVLL